MKLMWLSLCLCLSPAFAHAQEQAAPPSDRLRILVWNIQRGANHFERGPEKALAVIRAAAPDVCLLQESYDVDGDRPELGAWLAEQLGWNAWQGESPHLCVLTRFTIEKKLFHAAWHGVGARLVDDAGRRLLVYSTWIDWREYLPYALRDDAAITDEKLLACETDSSDRLKQAEAILKHLKESGALESEVPLLVGGDWNCPSHLDWTDDAARVFRFRRALPLPVSQAMTKAGFEDTFRRVHPDPTRVPGITWTPLERGTVEAPMPADRIDRLYLKRGSGKQQLVAAAAHVLPRVHEPMATPAAERIFPSDHGAVVIDLMWVEAPDRVK